VATFPGTTGGMDLYVSEFKNDTWSKPKNLGKAINTINNESNPGLLNEHTLTYSSNGVIKKVDLNSLEVENVVEKPIVVVPEVKPPVVKEEEIVSPVVIKENIPTPVVAKEKIIEKSTPIIKVIKEEANVTPSINGVTTAAEMLKSVGVAIQLGAFRNPN